VAGQAGGRGPERAHVAVAQHERRGDLQKLTDEYVLVLVGRLPEVLFNAPIT